MAKYDYDAYGAVREQNGQRSNSFKYVAQIGHPTDEETGLIYMRARYYEPVTDRFISEDPARDGVNWYLYADGNPVNKVDLSGRVPLLLVAFLVGFVIGAIGDLAFQSWTKGGRIDWIEVISIGLGSGLALTGITWVISTLGTAEAVSEAALAIATIFTSKQVSLAVAGWAIGWSIIVGGGGGLLGAAIYNAVLNLIGAQLRTQAALDSLEE